MSRVAVISGDRPQTAIGVESPAKAVLSVSLTADKARVAGYDPAGKFRAKAGDNPIGMPC